MSLGVPRISLDGMIDYKSLAKAMIFSEIDLQAKPLLKPFLNSNFIRGKPCCVIPNQSLTARPPKKWMLGRRS